MAAGKNSYLENIAKTEIPCSSRSSVEETIKSVSERMTGLINSSVYWTEDEQERYRQRFKEVYESSIQENITIDGQKWNNIQDTEGTTEFEPFDTNKRNEYNNTLLPHLDELICSIAETRKESPFLCVQQMAQECKYVHKDVVTRKATVGSLLSSLPKKDTSANESSCHSTFKHVCSATTPLLQVGPKLWDSASKLCETLDKQSTVGNTQVDQTIFKPLPDEHKMAESMTDLHHRLRSAEQCSPLKKSHPSASARILRQNCQRRHVLRKGHRRSHSK